jgi:predicted metal-binding membrane protein
MTSPLSVTAPSLSRTRAWVLGSLLVLAAAGWAVLAWQSSMTDMDDVMNMLTMDMSAALFIAVWVAMMVAMMFPTAAPMALTFADAERSAHEQGHVGPAARPRAAFGATALFMGAYLAVWTVFGGLAYGAARALTSLADDSMWLMDNAARLGGAIIVAAGLYQLTSVKSACLQKCRDTRAFVRESWGDGYGGALRMGVEHGVYCLGCCWLFFVIIFPLGMMSLGILAALVVLIFAEKALPFGRWASRLAAVALVAYGVVVIFVPDALPTAMQ